MIPTRIAAPESTHEKLGRDSYLAPVLAGFQSRNAAGGDSRPFLGCEKGFSHQQFSHQQVPTPIAVPETAPLAAGLDQRALAKRGKRGLVLLEVVISIAILALGVAAIGGQMFQAQRASLRADRMARAVLLAESLFTELDTGLILPEQEQEGDFTPFGVHYDGWAWRLIIDPSPDEGMFLVTVEIYYGHPDTTTDDLDDKALVYEAHTLRAEPGTVNLVEELGLGEEILEQVAALPGIPPDFDPENINPAQLAKMLQEFLGEEGEGLLDLTPEELGTLMKYVQSLSALTQSLAELGGGGGQDLLGGMKDLIPPDLLKQGTEALQSGGRGGQPGQGQGRGRGR